MSENKEPEVFPKMNILPGIGWVKRVGGKMISLIYFFPKEAPELMSNHFKGGGPTLDEALEQREHSLGHLVMQGDLSAQQAMEWLEENI